MKKTFNSKLSITVAGSLPNISLLKTYLENNIIIIHVYGLTETLGPHTVCEIRKDWKDLNSDELSKKISLQGIPTIHGNFVSVLNSSKLPVKNNGMEIGEVLIKGNNLMEKYHNKPEITDKAFKSGFFHTGDLATIDENGYIEIKGRKKDIIISGGEKIPSGMLEQVIKEYKGILEVAIIPFHDKKWGESPHAIIQTRDNTKILKSEIFNFCKKRLPGFMVPKKITFDIILKTATGKISKSLLIKKYIL